MLKLVVPPAPRRGKLTEDERVILVNLLAAHPKASLRAIAEKFEVRVGRAVALASVRRARLQGYVSPASGHGRSLTEAQRAMLRRLCEADPDATGRTIAGRFREATGRPLGIGSVNLFRGRHLGIRHPRGHRSSVAP